LSHQYAVLKKSNDKWNQIIMLVSTVGALVTSVLTIAGKTGWPYEIVPIVIQTFSGMLAGWMRFYDFPKRMEAIINAKHTYQEIREKFQRSPIVDKALWDEFTRAVKSLDDVLSPEERDKAHANALKYMRKERQREAQLTALISMTHEQVLNNASFKSVEIHTDTDSLSSNDSPRPGVMAKVSRGIFRGKKKAHQVEVNAPIMLRTDEQIVTEAAQRARAVLPNVNEALEGQGEKVEGSLAGPETNASGREPSVARDNAATS